MEVETKPSDTVSSIDENGEPQKSSREEKESADAGSSHEKAPEVNAPGSIQPGEEPSVPSEDSPERQESGALLDGEPNGGDNELTFDGIKAAVGEIDDNIDDALGQAADSFWNFATSVTGKVTNAVKDGQPGFENLRKNVTSRLAPLDHIGRDLTSHIGALTRNEAAIANITGSVKSVAETVQRNAQAMEAAILAKANMTESSEASWAIEPSGVALDDGGASEVAVGDPAMGVLPLISVKGDVGPEDVINVNEEIAKVGEKISNSLVGQTVGDIWTGLWGNSLADEHGNGLDGVANVPKTRFEKRIFELQANPDTYCEPAKDLNAFEQWSKSFVLDDNAESCIAVLDCHESIAELYERVVPRIVDEDTFWMRYFFARHVLEKEEERRKRLLERAENAVAEGDDDDGWGDDDWDDDTQVQAEHKPVDGEPAPATVENGEDIDSEIPSFTENQEDIPHSEAASRAVATKKGVGIQGAETGAFHETAAASKPVTKVEVVSAPADDWGDDDWE